MSGAPPTLGETDLKGTMGIDGRQLMGDSRWTAHEILWNAVVVNVTTHWWFGPLLVSILISAGWKKVTRFGAYVSRAFGHTDGGT